MPVPSSVDTADRMRVRNQCGEHATTRASGPRRCADFEGEKTGHKESRRDGGYTREVRATCVFVSNVVGHRTSQGCGMGKTPPCVLPSRP